MLRLHGDVGLLQQRGQEPKETEVSGRRCVSSKVMLENSDEHPF